MNCRWISIPLLICLGSATTRAAVSPDQAAELGGRLTPIGAEKAGSADGSIPAWTGGRKKSGPLSGEFPHDDKIDGDHPLFTITHANYEKFSAHLTAGHQELLRRYPDYKMIVYPTRRRVSFPGFIEQATRENATRCKLEGTDVPDGCKLGFPFPVPTSGAEIIWNHKLKWRGNSAERYNNQFIVQPDGSYQQTKIVEQVKFYYANGEHPVPMKSGQGEFLRYLSETLAPPRLAGTFILVHERSGTGGSGRAAWLYSPGLRRIRRAPTVEYDNPYEGTDGNEFYDQVDMFNGALDRYTWKLVGKREMYLPYNSDRIAGNHTTYREMIHPHHLNQDLPRYELHRYWIVEASLRPGMHHTFASRRFYVDEDSWNIEAVDDYDRRGQLYKFQEGHLITAPNIQAATTVPEVIYDFFSGRYFITAAFNEDQPVDLTKDWPDDYFTAGSVQKHTLR